MIKKIIKIENVGNFVNCRAVGDTEFRPVTLIYGENARGKSTFVAVLRSLASGDPTPVLGRKCLGVAGEPTVEILLESGVARFKDGAWNVSCPKIAVFDQQFVHENVYAGDYVEHEHRKNLLNVMLGAGSVQLARRVEECDANAKEQTKIISEHRVAIERFLPQGAKLDGFFKLDPDAEVDAKIEAKNNEIARLARAQEIAKTDALRQLELPEVPPSLREVAAATIDSVTQEAEGLVRKHIASHGIAEQWLSDGLDSARDTCPFCGQSTAGLSLLSAFRGYFSQSYGSLKQKVTAAEQDMVAAFGESRVETLKSIVDRNGLLADFWAPIVGHIELPTVDFPKTLAEVRQLALAALAAKRRNLLEESRESPELAASLAELANLHWEARNVNCQIAEFNRRIVAVKADTAGKSAAEARRELAHLELVKLRHSPELLPTCAAYSSAIERRRQIEQEKVRAKAELDAYVESMFVTHQAKVNELLEDFAATFRITRPVRKYSGGTASAAYGVLINNVEVELGDRDLPDDRPSFRNTLSASDRLTLALAFFLSSCHHDPALADAVVVLDDPFTSQDRSRQWHTQKQILRLSQRAKQVVVLSHHPQFLKPVADETPSATLRTLQLMRVRSATSIVEWDPAEAGDQFAQEYRRLTKFVDEGASTADEKRSVARAIRPLIEGRVRMLCPFAFDGCTQFGEVLGRIREAPATSPAAHLKPILDDLDELNSFARRYMHGDNPAADAEQIDDGELLVYVKRSIKIAQGLPG